MFFEESKVEGVGQYKERSYLTTGEGVFPKSGSIIKEEKRRRAT
jgi:hypothetical protein